MKEDIKNVREKIYRKHNSENRKDLRKKQDTETKQTDKTERKRKKGNT